jgi:hypothetical protein
MPTVLPTLSAGRYCDLAVKYDGDDGELGQIDPATLLGADVDEMIISDRPISSPSAHVRCFVSSITLYRFTAESSHDLWLNTCDLSVLIPQHMVCHFDRRSLPTSTSSAELLGKMTKPGLRCEGGRDRTYCLKIRTRGQQVTLLFSGEH